MRIQGTIQGKSIVLDKLPQDLKEGERVEVVLVTSENAKRKFSTFQLGVDPNFLNREKIYGKD